MSSHVDERLEARTPAFKQAPEHPNFPEVSGTSLPLLSTVLAGFAVTLTVQLMIRPDAADDLSGRSIVAIIAFLASTLLFLSSIVFAINAQAHNYLPFIDLSPEGRRLLGVEDASEWIRRIERRWTIFHLATIGTFYGGAVLLLAGVNLIVWIYVGTWVALVVLATILINIALTAAVTAYVDRMSWRVHRAADPVTADQPDRV
jgi:hypothetical protein